jgi:hypothetical protein
VSLLNFINNRIVERKIRKTVGMRIDIPKGSS